MIVVVSAKIEKEIKIKADKYGIKISKLVRDALEMKINIIEKKMLADELDHVRDTLGPRIHKEDVISMLKASRNER